MKQLILGGLVLTLTTLPVSGHAFRATNRHEVNPVNSAVFEVVGQNRSVGTDYWCAAADYAQRKLRASWQAPLYIARGRGNAVTTNRRSAVHFTLDPAAAGITPARGSLSLNSFVVGDSMSVQQAHTYCRMPVGRF